MPFKVAAATPPFLPGLACLFPGMDATFPGMCRTFPGTDSLLVEEQRDEFGCLYAATVAKGTSGGEELEEEEEEAR